jgi:large subunit ribosomal protein L14
MILVTVKRINPRRMLLLKWRIQRRYIKGSIHRAFIIRTKVNFRRLPGIYLKFNENTAVLVTKGVVPVSNRVYGPVFTEFCMQWPSLGCVSNFII